MLKHSFNVMSSGAVLKIFLVLTASDILIHSKEGICNCDLLKNVQVVFSLSKQIHLLYNILNTI